MFTAENRGSLRSPGFGLILVLLALLVGGVAEAAIVVLDSATIGYRYEPSSGDTIYFGDSTTNGSVTCSNYGLWFSLGQSDVFVDGDPDGDGIPDTLIFNASGEESNNGIRLSYNAYYGIWPHDITFRKLVIKQYEHASHLTGSGAGAIKFVGAHDINFDTCEAYVYSKDARCVTTGSGFSGSWRVNFMGGTYTNYCDYYSNRCGYSGAAFVTGADGDSGMVCGDDSSYSYYLRGVNVNSHAQGIVLQNGKNYVVACTVECDARNIKWDGAGWGEQGYEDPATGDVLGTCDGTANSYGILMTYTGCGNRIDSNYITSGTDWGGGRGIMIENTIGSEDGWVVISNNDVDVHEGPDKAYGDGANYEGRAFTIREIDGGTSRYIHVYGNTFKTTAMNIDLDTIPIDTMVPYTASQTAFKMQSGYDSTEDGNGCHFLIENNTFTSYSIDSGCFSVPIKFRGGYVDSTVIFRNNTYETDAYMATWFIGSGFRLKNSTFRRLTPNYSDTTFYFYHPGLPYPCGDNVFTDPTYDGADSSVVFYHSNQDTDEITFKRTIDIVVEGGLNGEPVIGAEITVVNNYEETVYQGFTNQNGMASGEVSYRYESRSDSDSLDYNPFTIIATSGNDADTILHTVAWNTSVPPMVLSNTAGGGTWEVGNVQIEINPIRNHDTIYVNLSHGNSPIGDSVVVCLSETGYVDSSFANRQAYAYTPNGSHSIYWATGQPGDYTAYVSAWVKDNLGNWSSRNTDIQSFQGQDLGTAQVQVDPRRVNDTVFVDVSNDVSPIGDSVIVCFSLTGYPDSSYVGRQAITYTPGDNNRLYWTVTGTEEYTVYVSAWIKDNSDNWSSRSTSSREYHNTAPSATLD